MGHQGTIVEHWKRILKTCAKGTKSRVYNNTCHEGLHGAHKSSQDTWHVSSPVPWRVPQGLAWCPRVESRHVTHATARAMTCATGPCLVPKSQAKTRDVCHRLCHDADHEALHVPTSRAKTRDVCHLLCHDNYNDPRHGARGCARTRAPCHDACHDLHAMVPRSEARHVSRATARSTTPVITHSMVVEGVPRDVARAMVRVMSGFWP